MEFLRSIAVDCSKVKTCVYERYSGIRSLKKLVSVFDIMTEMRHCGLREQLDLPAVYYELAVRDAITDIKGMWGVLKNKIRTLITANDNLSADDRMYLRTVLKLDIIYGAILNREDYLMPEKMKGLDMDADRLNNLLRRLTRKYLVKPIVNKNDTFGVPPTGYSYKEGYLYLTSRIKRRRVVLPLKDNKVSNRQIRVCIKENSAAIAIPVEARKQRHKDFQTTLYIHIGYYDMFTLSSGVIYGKDLGSFSKARSEHLMEKNRERNRVQLSYKRSLASGDEKKAENIKANNLGTFKYERQKGKEQARIETYINMQINQMLEKEKPGKIVVPKPVAINKTKFKYKQTNRMLAESFYGYIRKRLAEKCALHTIELVEINSKGTGSVCSECGEQGKRFSGEFVCGFCGYKSSIAINGARNLERKYKELMTEKDK